MTVMQVSKSVAILMACTLLHAQRITQPLPVQNIDKLYAGSPGTSTFYYWIVARYPFGTSAPSIAVRVDNVAMLGAANRVYIKWDAMPTGAAYDVLKKTVNVTPSGACNCAISLSQFANSVIDVGQPLQSYVVDTPGITFPDGSIQDTAASGVTNILHDPGANGVVVRISVGTTIARTITGSVNIVVSNGDGVSGNPVISLSDNPIVPGQVVIGVSSNSSLTVPCVSGGLTCVPQLDVVSDHGVGHYEHIFSTAYGDAFSDSGGFAGRFARGTQASPIAVGNLDTIFSFAALGWDGTKFADAGGFFYHANEDWTTTAHGSYLNIDITPNGTTFAVDLISLDGLNRNVCVGYFCDQVIQGTTATLLVLDKKPTVGSTQIVIRSGSGQGVNDLTQWQSNSSAILASISNNGSYTGPTASFTSGQVTLGDAKIAASGFGIFTLPPNVNSNSVVPSLCPSGMVVNSIGSSGIIGCTVQQMNGPAGGDLSGFYASNLGALGQNLSGFARGPTVSKINGSPLGNTTPTSGSMLVGDGIAWQSKAISGDVTISSSGVITLANDGVVAGTYTKVTVDAKGRVTNGLVAAAIDLSNGVTGSGLIVLSGAPTLTRIALTDNVNQIILGTTNTYTVTMSVLTGSRILTLPDADSNTVQPSSCPATQFVNSIGSSGVLSCAAPAGGGGGGGTFTNITVLQGANGDTALTMLRATDSSPTGNFEDFRDNASSFSIWRVDVNGVLQAGVIPFSRITGFSLVAISPITFNSGNLSCPTCIIKAQSPLGIVTSLSPPCNPLIQTQCGAVIGIPSVTGSGSTVVLNTSPTIVTTLILINDKIGVTSSDGLIIQNRQAAASGAQQQSPRLHWIGQGWKTDATAASQTVDWIVEALPVQGAANPTVQLIFRSQVNAGGFTELFRLDSSGLVRAVYPAANPTLDLGVLALDAPSGSTATVLSFRNNGTQQAYITYGTAGGGIFYINAAGTTAEIRVGSNNTVNAAVRIGPTTGAIIMDTTTTWSLRGNVIHCSVANVTCGMNQLSVSGVLLDIIGTNVTEVMFRARQTNANQTGDLYQGTNAAASVLYRIGPLAVPISVSTTPGTTEPKPFSITGAGGGNTTITTTGVGGAAGDFTPTLGNGGTANSANTADTGGRGGDFLFVAGDGAAATATGTNVGGRGGNIDLSAGSGGSASGGSSNTAGAAGRVRVVVGNFAFVGGKGQHFETQAANNDYVGTATLLVGTVTVTFTTAYASAPVCLCQDTTSILSCNAVPTASNVVLTVTGGASDAVAYICVGNPN